MLKGKTILVGITGSVAAYKAVDLIRRLRDAGATVKAIMTEKSKNFITPLSVSLACGTPVAADMFEEPFSHIDGPAQADVFVVAPATANSIGKFANGIADDLLSTSFLVFRGGFVLAPAMNWRMYENPVVKKNLASLLAQGTFLVEPQRGTLACGEEGVGKMADVDAIIEAVITVVTPKDLSGEHVLITAGPTREPIDPVRFLSNRSSGKMGYALARVARRRGALVTLVTGPTAIPVPEGVDVVRVETTSEMYSAVMERIDTVSIAVMTAAVSDFCVAEQRSEKADKADIATLRLDKTPDILAAVGALPRRPFMVGFAAETGARIDRAERKLISKGADMIVFNDVLREGAGFETDTNVVTIITRNADATCQKEYLPLSHKEAVASAIIDSIIARRA
ncbi:MAG TPA: bifunctional phosphopantothenoylcysteine decarboxylase/phosphopantothenate--cysteine ligase CoaBC [Dissulfurispiraceae bacterium]|nr:bifunctional phosphopantothenoylcysteine decarboxylase/phosphopantothenate--cysteine ligase CoaBC [Dissulfurispiraceae bacterium]